MDDNLIYDHYYHIYNQYIDNYHYNYQHNI